MGRGNSGLGKSGGGDKNILNVSVSDAEVLNRIDALPDLKGSLGEKENPIPDYAIDHGFDAWDEAFELMQNTKYDDSTPHQFETVPMDKVFTLQAHVDPNTLKSKVNADGVANAIYSAGGLNNNPIRAIKMGNDYILVDGNHRAALAKLANLNKIKLEVFYPS